MIENSAREGVAIKNIGKSNIYSIKNPVFVELQDIVLLCRHNRNLAYFYDKDILGLTVLSACIGHSVCICFLHPIMLPMSGWPLNNNRHWFWKYCY